MVWRGQGIPCHPVLLHWEILLVECFGAASRSTTTAQTHIDQRVQLLQCTRSSNLLDLEGYKLVGAWLHTNGDSNVATRLDTTPAPGSPESCNAKPPALPLTHW
ncbi:hypothetical protein GUJ93_ZPchr0012g19385 [Zizania palustris]|uniref:Secreted protein n=1 Tax=Zizania palustris TaxID=103762 RepID=A0A8J5WMI3_ZIZPA|nr:hypothetical protein GUJ93_ZPchr0012g19385 [Zizania palustris]